MWHAGECVRLELFVDEVLRAARITEAFERGRRAGAPWAVAWEAGAGHEAGRSAELGRVFLAEAARLRLDEQGRVRGLRAEEGVVLSRASCDRVEAWPKDAAAWVRTVWLPGPRTAALWRAMGEGEGR